MKQLTMKLKDLIRPERNIRIHTEKQLQEFERSVKMFGQIRPIVIVEHSERSEDIYGTVTHNRARGTHLLEPMKAIVKELMNEGKTVDEIGKQLGMKPEEIFRLSDFTKEDFLNMMTKGVSGFSKAEFVTKV